jgi:hypothetical protein
MNHDVQPHRLPGLPQLAGGDLLSEALLHTFLPPAIVRAHMQPQVIATIFPDGTIIRRYMSKL